MDEPTSTDHAGSEVSQPATKTSTSRSVPQDSAVTTSSVMAPDSQPSKRSSATNSMTPTPLGSRDSSPMRPLARTSASRASSTAGTRSRKNSVQELSPARPARSTIPVPPAGPRTISAATTPALPPSTPDSTAKVPGPQKLNTSTEGPKDNQWPVSPRLRSPPPRLNRPTAGGRRNENETPSISVQRATPSPHAEALQLTSESASETEESQLQSGVRTPARSTGILETVHEVSQPNSPGPSTDATLEKVKEKLSSELASRSDSALVDNNRTLRAKTSHPAAESGSETGSIKTDARRTTSVPAPPLMTRQSSAMSAKQGKPKSTAEGSQQHMTVETETVSSIPQVALAPVSTTAQGTSVLKSKPSSETIRPKKEKRKNRKQAPVTSGNASSKADIFEAKVASAVEDANTSDSEETFVYDSNPPDGGDRHRRFHSRTPSATSMVSQQERNAMRSIHAVMESGAPVTVKKNMKFVNTFNSNGGDSLAGDEEGKGTGRSNVGSARGTVRQHHHGHFGRWGRNNGNGHASLFDNESPFPNAARSLAAGANNNSRQSSQPSSPRGVSGRGVVNGKRSLVQQMSSTYDLDDTTGADDERTPLISSGTRRMGRNRRVPFSQRQLEEQSYRQRPSYLNRFAACLVVTIMLLLVITGAIGFIFATSQPLTNIELVAIKNVLASGPELMFDLSVKAHNPNIVVVTIDQANLEIFAKSIHAGTDSEWWKYPNGPPLRLPAPPSTPNRNGGDVHISDDPPDDPPDDDSAPNMRLGTITEFDNPLFFEGSFFHQGVSQSTSELRLHHPGNNTAGGSERWERILQDEFDLIVKGVLRYSMPLSQRVRSAAISGRTTVKPNSANDPRLKPNSTLALGR